MKNHLENTVRLSRSKKLLFSLAVLVATLGALEGALRLWGAWLFPQERRTAAPRPKPPDELRVLSIGDSFTHGLGAESELSYPAQLQKILAARLGRVRVRCLNAGVPGYNLSDCWQVFRHEAERFQPDIMLLLAGANDLWKPSPLESFTESPRERSDPPLRLLLLGRIFAANLEATLAARGDGKPSIPRRQHTPLATSVKAYMSGLVKRASRVRSLGPADAAREIIEIDRLLHEIQAWESGQAFVQYHIGMIQWNFRRNEVAERHFLRAAERAPHWPLPWIWVGNLRAEKRQWRQASEYFQQALARDPSAPLPRLHWAYATLVSMVSESTGREIPVEEIDHLQKNLLEAGVELPGFLPHTLQGLSMLGEIAPPGVAETCWNTFLAGMVELYPDRLPAWLAEGIQALRKADREAWGSPPHAIVPERELLRLLSGSLSDRLKVSSEVQQKLRSPAKESWSSYLALARLLPCLDLSEEVARSEFLELRKHFALKKDGRVIGEQIFERLPDLLLPSPLSRYAEAFVWESREFEQELQELESLLTSIPPSGSSELERAFAEAFRRTKERFPRTAEGAFQLGALAGRQPRVGLTAEAVPLFEDSAGKDPSRWETWFILGAEYQRMDRQEESLEVFQRAHRLNPTDPELTIMLANALRLRAGAGHPRDRQQLLAEAFHIAQALVPPASPPGTSGRQTPLPIADAPAPALLRSFLLELKEDLADDPTLRIELDHCLSLLAEKTEQEQPYWSRLREELHDRIQGAIRCFADSCRAQGIRLFVLCYPPPDGANVLGYEAIGETNRVLQEVSDQHGVPWIDFEESFQALGQKLKIEELWTSDWHPKSPGYRAMAETIAERITPALQARAGK